MEVTRQFNAKPTLALPEFIALAAMLTSLVALSIDAILPAMDLLASDLHSSSSQQTQLSISVFFVGMALGQLFFGPFSDAKGRLPAISLGLVIFGIGSAICMFSTNMNMFLIGRVVQAFGASGPRIASTAAIRDIYSGNAMARVMSFIMMVFILVPMLAPIIGQWIINAYTWHGIFVMFIGVGGVSGVWYFLRQPETYPKALRKSFSWGQLGQSLTFIFSHRKVMNYILATGCIFGCFLAYISASHTIFVGYYGQEAAFPYIFSSLAFSIGLASYFNGKMVMRFGMQKLVKHALRGAISFSIVLLAVLFFYNGLPPLMVTLSVLFVGFFFVGILFGNMNAMAMEHLGHIAGLGAAIVGSLSNAISVPVAIVIDSYLDGNLYSIGIGFLVCFSLAKINMKMAALPSKS
ncbi:multidrug effflux MFS transporter [Alteromonas sp. 5E99-2]|uniref:multidrug effflux MFS transporter n=1 Tax=Alteromonas sp. 5E99-2 TaxID=2817683 RepID=UPI001A984B2C|nr:multidrug effflux MFS transporter [Alteromonas sp. 5E99-2]MBO1254807.1 multidrug effflux MFS transporter [Alteromonas sp. 5E99-2]